MEETNTVLNSARGDGMDCGRRGNSEVFSGDGTTFAGIPAIASGGFEKTESRRCSGYEVFNGVCSASGLGSMFNGGCGNFDGRATPLQCFA